MYEKLLPERWVKNRACECVRACLLRKAASAVRFRLSIGRAVYVRASYSFYERCKCKSRVLNELHWNDRKPKISDRKLEYMACVLCIHAVMNAGTPIKWYNVQVEHERNEKSYDKLNIFARKCITTHSQSIARTHTHNVANIQQAHTRDEIRTEWGRGQKESGNERGSRECLKHSKCFREISILVLEYAFDSTATSCNTIDIA